MSDEEDKTVIRPAGIAPVPPASKPADAEAATAAPVQASDPPPLSSEPLGGDAEATIVSPSRSSEPPPLASELVGGDAEATIVSPARNSPPPPPAPEPRQRSVAGVQVGDVLNGIFELTRFIDRGGMGEVYEGCNARRRRERVAIKVILPSLAADPKIREIFENEADTLEKLGHEALVRYRLFNEDPNLGIFYLVTDFIDGVPLSKVLATLQPTPEELINVAARLASGLRAAHKEGVVHRDMSPDNVILEGGKLERARIIDFGIAKNTDPGSKTIIGDGFAGKLGYVAPEQLGDFSRDVGPWTDVYSLGLVILAIAQGRGSDLGGSFMDAINKRRAGVDTSAAPGELRPVLDRMLAADPAQRFQSMDEVLTALSRIGTAPPAPARRQEPAPADAKPAPSGAASRLPRSALIGGGVAAALLLGGGLAFVAFSGGDAPAPVVNGAAPARTPDGAAVTLASVEQGVQAELSSVPCAWLNMTGASGSPSGVQLAFTGVAGRPAEAENRIFSAVQAKGATVASSDFSGVAPISPSFCPVLDAIGPIRTPVSQQRLTLTQPKYEIARFNDGENSGQLGARVIVEISLANLQGEFALFGIEEDGETSPVIPSRAAFMDYVQSGYVTRLPGEERYRMPIDGTTIGWSGFLLIKGGNAPDPKLFESYGQPNWRTSFDQAASANGWKAEMVWSKVVDELPN